MSYAPSVGRGRHSRRWEGGGKAGVGAEAGDDRPIGVGQGGRPRGGGRGHCFGGGVAPAPYGSSAGQFRAA